MKLLGKRGFGQLEPVSRSHGSDRGTSIYRYFIEDFLSRHAGMPGYMLSDIRGHVLEIGDDFYSKKFGVAHAETARDRHDGAPAAVTRIDVLHVDASNPTATIVADLTHAPEIADNTFDCIVCVQTLLLIYEVRAAIQTLRRILKPGGVVLVTVPVVSRICRPEADVWGDYWRFTSHSARRLFAEAFGGENVSVEAYGNVLTAAACLYGLAAEELPSSALTLNDPDFEVLVAIRAVKVPSAS